MKTRPIARLCGVLSLLAAAAATPAEPERAAAVAPYTVFVDPPTGYVFVKLPQGWRFVAAVGAEDVARLPPQVVTHLLEPEAGRDRVHAAGR